MPLRNRQIARGTARLNRTTERLSQSLTHRPEPVEQVYEIGPDLGNQPGKRRRQRANRIAHYLKQTSFISVSALMIHATIWKIGSGLFQQLEEIQFCSNYVELFQVRHLPKVWRTIICQIWAVPEREYAKLSKLHQMCNTFVRDPMVVSNAK